MQSKIARIGMLDLKILLTQKCFAILSALKEHFIPQLCVRQSSVQSSIRSSTLRCAPRPFKSGKSKVLNPCKPLNPEHAVSEVEYIFSQTETTFRTNLSQIFCPHTIPQISARSLQNFSRRNGMRKLCPGRKFRHGIQNNVVA